MSDPEVPQNDKPDDIDDVVGSANEGLDAAAAARADRPADATIEPDVPAADAAAGAADRPADASADADMEAFAAAERDYPGTFGAGADETERSQDDADADDTVAQSADEVPHYSTVSGTGDVADTHVADTHVADTHVADTHSVAESAYGAGAGASVAETQVMPAEPVAPPAAPQPIFVQAPEPPRELGNRATAGGIGLLAAIAFAILYLGAILGLGALAGEVTAENIGTSALAPLSTWAFWVPVVVFYLAFWLLGAFVNRARWGKWVTLGLLVALAAYGGHILGQLFQAPFWSIAPSDAAELVNEQLLAPLAIAAFVFARELTIWFGAWVARSGAKKKALNAEAQAEYERTLEAGPAAAR
ncbi:ABC transporter [Microbacterium sp. ARD32]|uniref:ABC transporter n=1 Tax=Microbacterium sp. ARD32 TaxID=2962577 RepID=UPI00288222D5|nr:ABC transporter [Microbacterium sp. ARD32]MDT0158365.1 ABC transporter [Microbacterium sp. ARD32]